MSDFFANFSGYKTYIIAIVVAALGIVKLAYPEFEVPEWAMFILAGGGAAALRSGINKE